MDSPQTRYPKKVTKNFLWALLGAQLDMDWRELPEVLKREALVEMERQEPIGGSASTKT